MSDLKFKDVTDGVLRCFFTVYNQLGYGFLEKVYENAMVIELRNSKFEVIQQFPIKVLFRKCLVGEYFADLIINGRVIVEIKAVDRIPEIYTAQLINYLHATDLEIGLLLNFGPQPAFIRKIFTNDRKKNGPRI